jgi:putative salt-induced outer membrane protein
VYTFFLLAHIGFADQVTLKNGDRLSGSIQKNDGKHLTLKSELAGVVTIPWDAVTAIAAPQLHVGLKDGKTVVGAVTTTSDSGKLEIAVKEDGIITADKDAVQFMRSSEEEVAYQKEEERYRRPRLIDLWQGALDLGFATSHGNSKTSNLNVGGAANRTTRHDKIAVYYTSIFASNKTSGVKVTTANAKRGGIAYNRDVAKKWFAFGSLDFDSDQFQSLDIRVVPAGGLGGHLIKTEATVLNLQVGAAANREVFSTGLKRTSGEGLLGQEFTRKFSKSTLLQEKFVFYPSLTELGEYRMNFDTSFATILRRWLSWQLTVSDRLLSNPVAGRKKNDVLLTTGLRITFAR